MSKLTDQKIIESYLARGTDLEPNMFPYLSTLSPAFTYQFTPVALVPEPPEIVFVPPSTTKEQELVGILWSWNSLWEGAQFRKDVFRHQRYAEVLPDLVEWINNLPEANIYLVAETRTQYDAYSPLLHLLPKQVLDRHGLPALRRAIWPCNATSYWTDKTLPPQFVTRLSRAFAEQVWPYLDSGSGLSAFDSTEPLVVLSHSLDFWLPAALRMIEGRMRQSERVAPETDKQRNLLAEAKAQCEPDVTIERPRMGGYLWQGEEDAAEALAEVVNVADRDGQLRGIIDSVRSNRVVDDFSARWSFAKADFERKLYRKRTKVRVSFVELDDTMPVHSARCEYTDDLLWQDFSALLNVKERHIIVCLRNGTTKLRDIADSLGYGNHSPISKALTRIRKKAEDFLNLN